MSGFRSTTVLESECGRVVRGGSVRGTASALYIKLI